MEELITNFLETSHVIIPVIALLVSLYTVGKGADILVDNAVSLSVQWGVPKMIWNNCTGSLCICCRSHTRQS